jgi:uncharacterized membrane protein YozB (DUF420 family)
VDIYTFVATLSLSLQIAVLALLLAGYFQKRKGKFRRHGFLMLAAVVVHLIVILAVMVPSLVIGLIPFIVEQPTEPVRLLSIAHAATGTIAAVLGVWIVGSWRLRTSLQFCSPKRRFMLATIAVWTVALALGIVMYFVFYWQLLFV